MIHAEALTPAAKNLFPLLSFFKRDFYLAGGTALALQLGHRVSVDFDLFSSDPIKEILLSEIEATYASFRREIQINNSGELTLLIEGVKHTFLHYPFSIISPLVKASPIDLLSPREILVTKAYTIGRRGAFKDYIDLREGLSRNIATLAEIIEWARQKYGNGFNDRLFLEQLLYLDDVSEDALVMLGSAMLSKQAIKDFFTAEIGKLRL